MTGFEPRASGVGIDRSTNCATTTSLKVKVIRAKIYRAISISFVILFIKTSLFSICFMLWSNKKYQTRQIIYLSYHGAL